MKDPPTEVTRGAGVAGHMHGDPALRADFPISGEDNVPTTNAAVAARDLHRILTGIGRLRLFQGLDCGGLAW